MPYIRVNSDTPVVDGQRLTFRAPADCSQVLGLQVCYFDRHKDKTLYFSFADAYGKNINSTDSFKQGALVEVILDTTNDKAFVQNANTNPYLEAKFNERPLIAEESLNDPDCFYRTVGDEREYYNSPNNMNVEYRTFERFEEKPVYSIMRRFSILSEEITGFQLPIEANNIFTDAWYIQKHTIQVDANTQKTSNLFINFRESDSPIKIFRRLDLTGFGVYLQCAKLDGQEELECCLLIKYTKD